MPTRPARVRIQAMLEPEVGEQLKVEALRKGISVSAMAAILIKESLATYSGDDKIRINGIMESRVRKIIELAEEHKLL